MLIGSACRLFECGDEACEELQDFPQMTVTQVIGVSREPQRGETAPDVSAYHLGIDESPCGHDHPIRYIKPFVNVGHHGDSYNVWLT